MKSGIATTISCVISGLTNQVTVEWLDSATTPVSNSDYVQSAGTFHSTDFTQTSTLEISGNLVTADKTFICRVRSLEYSDSPSSDTMVELSVYGKCSRKFE